MRFSSLKFEACYLLCHHKLHALKHMAKKTYAEVMQEIERLQAHAVELRQTEVEEVVNRIREAIEAYGLTPAELFGSPGKPQAAGRARKGAAKKGVARKSTSATPAYRDGQGNTWGGRGPRPRWLREALAGGASLESFRVA